MDPVQAIKPAAAGQEVPAMTNHEVHSPIVHPEYCDEAAYDALVRLVSEHREYDRQLRELMAMPWPSETEKLEQVRLKKLKLRQKDEIEQLRHEMQLYAGQNLEH